MTFYDIYRWWITARNKSDELSEIRNDYAGEYYPPEQIRGRNESAAPTDCRFRDIYSLGLSCMRVTIGELSVQTRIATTFHYDISCVLALVTQKVQVICRRSARWMTTLLSEKSIFCVRAGCEIQRVSYPSKYASQSLFDKPCLHIQCTKAHNWNFRSYVDGQHIKSLEYYHRLSLCRLQLHKRFDWGAMTRDTHQLFSDTTLRVYTVNPYIHCYLVCNYAWQTFYTNKVG